MPQIDLRKVSHPANSEFRLARSPFYLIAHADFNYHEDILSVLTKRGVNRLMYRILTVLREHAPASISFLAHQSLAKRNTISRVVERMSEKGLVKAYTNSRDNRVTDVEMTAAGRDLLAELAPLIGRLYERAFVGVSNDEIEQLVGILQKITNNLDRHLIESFSEIPSEGLIRSSHLTPGQAWTIGFDSLGSAGLSLITCSNPAERSSPSTEEVGSDRFQSSVDAAYAVLDAHRRNLLGTDVTVDRTLTVRGQTFGDGHCDGRLALGVLVALCSAHLQKSVRDQMAFVGDIGAEGEISPLDRPLDLVELAAAEGAREIIMPVSCRRSLVDLPDDLATEIEIRFYASASEAVTKALAR